MKIEDEGEDSDDNDDSKKSEVVQLDPIPEEKEEQIEDAEKIEEMVQKEELKVAENFALANSGLKVLEGTFHFFVIFRHFAIAHT